MAPERLANIFQPFQRGEAHGQKGVGLGLAITDRIVREHGAHLKVTSHLGQGSCFSITFPAAG